MEINEAIEIFDIFRNWFHPCHIILHTAFMGIIPESFLPYSVHTIWDALTVVANSGLYDEKQSLLIMKQREFLTFYVKDEEAYQFLSKALSKPRIVEAIAKSVKINKKFWAPDQLKVGEKS